MLEQGRSTLAPDDSGRVLDRLAGLEQVISNEAVKQALVVTGRVGHVFSVLVDNLGDELYSEFSNATFFRPQPGRSVSGIYRLRF